MPIRRRVEQLRTVSVGVDVEGGGGDRRVSQPVLGDTLDRAVVAPRAHRGHAQHGAVRHRQHRVPALAAPAAPAAVPRRRQPAPGAARRRPRRPPEVDVRRRVAGGEARERRDAAVDDLLVARSLRDPRSVYARTHARTRGQVT